MKKIELDIIVLSHSVTQSHSFSVVLGEVGGTRRLAIVIGGFEAQAIAVALDNMKPSRPLTHDLMKALCDTFDIQLEHIFITKLLDGVFYSNLVCKRGEEIFEVDSRTSDALALLIDGLPEKEKLLLSLYYWEELTMKEIGKVMNLTMRQP